MRVWPHSAAAAAAPLRGDAGARPRDAVVAGHDGAAAFCVRRRRRAPGSAFDAGRVQPVGRRGRSRNGGGRADGIRSVLLFGLPDQKDDIGSAAYDPEAPVQSAIRAIKREVPGRARDDRRVPLRIHRPRPLRHRRSTTRSPTIPPSISSCARRCRMRRQAPTSSRLPT